MLNYLSIAVVPIMIASIVGYGLLKRQPIFDYFIDGAKDGIETSIRILPALVGLITSISMLRASGTLDIICHFLSPVLSAIHFPEELVPLALMRPISGSGALAVVTDLLTTHGADSLIGRCASVMMGSTETTFYTLAVYFGSVGIRNTRYTVKAALTADLMGILASVYIVQLLFYG